MVSHKAVRSRTGTETQIFLQADTFPFFHIYDLLLGCKWWNIKCFGFTMDLFHIPCCVFILIIIGYFKSSGLKFMGRDEQWKTNLKFPPNLSSILHFQESIINYLAYNFFSLSLSSGLVLPVWKAMEKRLGVRPSPASWILSGFCWLTSVKWLKSLYAFYTYFCFSALWLSTGTILSLYI